MSVIVVTWRGSAAAAKWTAGEARDIENEGNAAGADGHEGTLVFTFGSMGARGFLVLNEELQE